jgi:hypothetical protein
MLKIQNLDLFSSSSSLDRKIDLIAT